jgi:radical SAM superfamily enzyme YgiQ (UPF0313 family)
MTALGPVCVATSANKVEGWDAEVIDENNYRRGRPPRDAYGRPDHVALQQARPADVVGLYGGLSSTVPRLYELAKLYKSLGVTTIAGGQHFVGDNIAEALHSGVDFLVIGEGELTIKDILTCLEGKVDKAEVQGIAYLENGEVVCTPAREHIMDFDALPMPDFGLVRYAKIATYPVGRVRGCGMNCEFCTVKGRPRYASADRLAEQFALLFETRGATRFFIVDDLFGQDREETLRLCGMLRDLQRRVGKTFSISVQIRLDRATDAELLEAMREAGVFTVAIGFESPIPEELKAMNKRLKPEDMIALARLYRRAGFFVHGMFIFAYPMEEGAAFRMGAKERVKHFRKFIRRAHVDTVQVHLPVPLPGTELTRRLEQQNRIYSRDDVGWEYYDGNFPLFEPDPPLTAEEMHASVRRIMGRFYRFRYLFAIGLHTISLPALALSLHRFREGWQGWLRRWWSNVFRFSGWLIMRRWVAEFNKGGFTRKLAQAKKAHAAGSGGDERTGPARRAPG